MKPPSEESPATGSVRRRAVRGIGAMAVLQMLGAAATFLTLLALARLLTPRDFGLAALAALVTGIVGTFGDFGLGPAVIQRTDRVDEALYTAGTLRLMIAIALLAITVSVAPLAAVFFSAREATDAIRVAAVLFVLNGAAFIPLTRLTKELRFGVVLRAAATSAVVSAVVSVSLAWLGFGYWSIIIASVVAALVNLGAFWIQSPWELRFALDRRLARDLIRYGKHLFLMNVFVFFIFNVDNAAIAYSLGPTMLGFYALAFKWANVPVNFLSKVAAQVMMPTYVLLKDSPDRLKKGYFETILMVNAVSWPVYIGLFILAGDFVEIVLGPVWLPIVTPLRILCGLGILRGLTEPGGYLFLATGRSDFVSLTAGLHAASLIAFLIPGIVYGGIVGVAASVVGAYVINAILVQHLVRRSLGVGWIDVGRKVRGLLGAGSGMAILLLVLSVMLPSSLIAFLLAAAAGLILYLGLWHLLERGMLSRYVREILEGSRRSTG